jgi:hypothetical protein
VPSRSKRKAVSVRGIGTTSSSGVAGLDVREVQRTANLLHRDTEGTPERGRGERERLTP